MTNIEKVLIIGMLAAATAAALVFAAILSTKLPTEPTLQERIDDETAIVCLNGFQYMYGGYLHKGYMAPVFDKEDRLPKRCD